MVINGRYPLLLAGRINGHDTLDTDEIPEEDDPLDVDNPGAILETLVDWERAAGYTEYVSSTSIPYSCLEKEDDGSSSISTPLCTGALQAIELYFDTLGVRYSLDDIEYNPEANILDLMFSDSRDASHLARILIDINFVDVRAGNDLHLYYVPVPSFNLLVASLDPSISSEDLEKLSPEEIYGMLVFADFPGIIKERRVDNPLTPLLKEIVNNYMYLETPRFARYIF